MLRIRYCLILILLFVSPCGFGQSEKYLKYIDRYGDIAVAHMKKYRIPASITMAQGLLESGAGTSSLAVKGNNHFGIKCHNDWNGPYMLKTDDAPNEKFRVYKSVEESYEDHSRFLVGKRRYSSLFSLPITDYKGWAHGLNAAGYATSPTYATSLIRIIENYNLTELDKKGLSRHHHVKTKKEVGLTATQKVQGQGVHTVRLNNGNYYVVANAGDTYKSIAKEFETSERKLRKYNEVDKRHVLKAGDIVYLHKKERRAHKSLKNKYYVLQSGESMYDVAQKFGMRLKTLYKVNGFSPEHTSVVGERIRLR